jgi:DNA-binding IscR family transcriptional regulator
MQLTLFSDYSLRVLLYLTMHRERLVSVPEISGASRAKD